MLLKTKLLLAQVPLTLALLVLGAIAITTIGQLGAHSEKILKDNYRTVLATQRMKEAIERMDSAALFIALGQREAGQKLALPNRKLFEAELEVQKNNITEPGEEEATAVLLARWQDYAAHYDRFLQENRREALKEFFFTDLYPRFLAVKEGAEVILTMNQDAMVRKSDEVRRFSRRLETWITLAAVLAALVGILASVALTTRIIRPLSVLTQTARRIKEGDLEVRARVEGSDEITLLAREFNTMTDSLDRYRKSSLGELLQAQHASQAAIDSLPEPVVATDLEGKILNANRTAETWFGPVLSGSLMDAVRSLEPALSAAIDKARKHVLAGKGAYLPSDLEEAVKIAAPEGERYLLTQAAPVYDETGSLASISVILRDVTLFSKLDAMSKSLVATFAHEFRTPLTSLRLAVHILLEQLAGTMTEKQLDLIYAAREDCDRLRNLIDDILSMGERTSVRIFSAALRNSGVESRYFDPYDTDWPIITDSSFSNANPLLEECEARIMQNVLPIVEKGTVRFYASNAGIVLHRRHLLRRKHLRLENVAADHSAQRAETDPKVFTRIHFHFVVRGRGLKPNLVERAIKLSHDKYCSASAMLAKTAELSLDWEIVED